MNIRQAISKVFPPKSKEQMFSAREVQEYIASTFRESMESRYFPAADVGRLRGDWAFTSTSTTDALKSDYSRLFARAKYAYETDPYARSAVRVLDNQIIGTGIRPKAKPVDNNGEYVDGLAKIINDKWSRFNDECFRTRECSFYESQSRAIQRCCVSGGLFFNQVKNRAGSMLPLAFQMVDQSDLDFGLDNYSGTINGVKINEYGEPIEYNFESVKVNSLVPETYTIPGRNLIHVFDKWDTTQYIGIPWLAPVLTTLWDLAQLKEDKIIASRIVAAIALWVQKKDRKDLRNTKNDDGNVPWAPGRVMSTEVKPEVIQAADSIKDTFGVLTELYLRDVAAGMGVSYQEMTSDMAGANFASSRGVVIDRRRHYRTRQKWIVYSHSKPIYNRFVSWLFMTGQIPGLSYADYKANEWGYTQAKWTPHAWDWVDPVKDIESKLRAKEAGLMSDEMYFEETGSDGEAVYEQLAKEKQRRKELGIEPEPLHTGPGRPKEKVIPPTEEEEEEDNDD